MKNSSTEAKMKLIWPSVLPKSSVLPKARDVVECNVMVFTYGLLPGQKCGQSTKHATGGTKISLSLANSLTT